MIKLESRLETIAGMIPKCRLFADIGADHGLLSARLIEMGACQRAHLVDISEASLQKARRLMAKLGFDDRTTITVGDGVLPLNEKPDCAVIAGMGGQTIAGIVEKGRKTLEASLVITQPNVGIYELRRSLSSAGWLIEDEKLARCAGRWYVIIAWRMSNMARIDYSDLELMAGPILLKKGGDDLKAYADFRIRVALKALAVEREGLDGPTIAMKKELGIWREVQKCL
ncbi:MAG: class I SAM-dependent methyltransferase [Clostridia bacterium]|nr:class I SAM-dependent methyltransferase [Clostridia bacterium]